MKTFAAFVLALLLPGGARAQVFVATKITAQSLSGQFIVHGGQTTGTAPHSFLLNANTDLTFLEPPLLAISCERIKQALWQELGEKPAWKGQIHLYLRPARSAADPILVDADKMANGWTFRVFLPDALTEQRFVDAIVQALLYEIANRGADSRSADVPAWLVQGFSAQLQRSSQSSLLIAPPSSTENGLALSRINFDQQKFAPLAHARQVLRDRPPLTFAQLSFPAPNQFSGEAWEIYRASAQLFVSQLLQLKGGRAAMHTMISRLAQRYNWQLALVDAFSNYFQRPLDIEKWWALQLASVAGRDLDQLWTPGESWKKLDEVLHSAVEVRTNPGELPLRSTATLQTIIRETGALDQARVLPAKVQELFALRIRASQDLAALVDDYRAVLQRYLQQHVASFVNRRKARVSDKVAEQAALALDALDRRREALRPAPTTTANTATQVSAERVH
jgi:hypothetical protein